MVTLAFCCFTIGTGMTWFIVDTLGFFSGTQQHQTQIQDSLTDHIKEAQSNVTPQKSHETAKQINETLTTKNTALNTATYQNTPAQTQEQDNKTNAQIVPDQTKETQTDNTKDLILGRWSNLPFKGNTKRESTIEFFDDGTFTDTNIFTDPSSEIIYRGTYTFSSPNRIKMDTINTSIGFRQIYTGNVSIAVDTLSISGDLYTDDFNRDYFTGENKWKKIQ